MKKRQRLKRMSYYLILNYERLKSKQLSNLLQINTSELPHFRTFSLKIIACVAYYIGRKIGSLGKVVGYARNQT